MGEAERHSQATVLAPNCPVRARLCTHLLTPGRRPATNEVKIHTQRCLPGLVCQVKRPRRVLACYLQVRSFIVPALDFLELRPQLEMQALSTAKLLS